MDLLIDEISEVALEAIEQAAGEAAKAAVLSMVEREAVMLRELQRWQGEAVKTKKAGLRNAVITGLALFAGGMVLGQVIGNR